MHQRTKKILFRSAIGFASVIYLVWIYFYLSNHVHQEKMGQRYDSTLEKGIDFTKPGYPNILSNVSGLSHPEAWGRWSDAKDEGKQVQLTFAQPLPKKFDLELIMKAYGPNQAEPILISIGSEKLKILLNQQEDNDKPQTILMHIEQQEVEPHTNAITLTPGKPTAPPKPPNFNPSNPGTVDQRLLGIGLISLRILNAQN